MLADHLAPHKLDVQVEDHMAEALKLDVWVINPLAPHKLDVSVADHLPSHKLDL